MCICHPNRTVNYDVAIPINLIKDLAVIKSGPTWNIDEIENILGKPGEYTTRTVRAFLALPGISTTIVDVDALEAILAPYAVEHDLSILITYYPNADRIESAKKKINFDESGSRQRITLDIWSMEVIDLLARPARAPGGFTAPVDPLKVTKDILKDMHLSVAPYYLNQLGSDTFGLEKLERVDADEPASKPDTQYDFNYLRVHAIIDGEPAFTDVRVTVPTVRDLGSCSEGA